MFSLFTKTKQSEVNPVISSARDFARRLRHNFVSAEHMMLGVLASEGPAPEVLQSYGVDMTKGFEVVLQWVGAGADDLSLEPVPPLTPIGKRIWSLANKEARRLSSPKVGAEHFLLAILRHHENMAVHILTRKFKIEVDDLKRRIESRINKRNEHA